MIIVDIPGRRTYKFEHLVLDFNGSLALDGELIGGVRDRINILRDMVDILIITADTCGNAKELAATLGVKVHKTAIGNEQVQKLEIVRQLGAEHTVCLGNGANDVLMLRASSLGICVIGPEGTASEALSACDVVAPDINVALDILIKPKRLIGTLCM